MIDEIMLARKEGLFMDVHRRQKLTTDFFKPFELTILVVNISISRQKYAYRGFQGVIF